MVAGYEPLRVAVVGCGNISRGYGDSLKARPDLVQVAGAFDLDHERTTEFAQRYGGRAYDCYHDLLDDDEVDAIVNLTVHHAHAEVSSAALEAGKHVHSEKPLATNREDGRMLLRLAKRRRLRLSCSPFTFLGEAQQTAWKAIREGMIGRVLIAYAEMNWERIESWHPSPEAFYQKGAGPLLDVGVYALTVLTTILGPVKSASGKAAILLPDRTLHEGPNKGKSFKVTTPDQVTGFLTFKSGALARLTASFLGYSRQGGVEFHGEKGTLYLSSSQEFNGAVEVRTPTQDWQSVPYVAEPYRGVEWGRAVFELAGSIRTGSPQHCTGSQAYHVLDTCLSILESAKTGKAVSVRSRFEPPAPSY